MTHGCVPLAVWQGYTSPLERQTHAVAVCVQASNDADWLLVIVLLAVAALLALALGFAAGLAAGRGRRPRPYDQARHR